MQRTFTKVKSYIGLATQPDEVTCQSTCIYAVTGGALSIYDIRAELFQHGEPGDPANMAETLKRLLPKEKHELRLDATLAEMKGWLTDGAVIITHGYFTGPGHVIVLDGCTSDTFDVMDPYEEFSAPAWDYPNRSNRTAYDGDYSDRLIYATCLAGQSRWDAARIYDSGAIDYTLKAAWCNVIFP